MSRVLLLATTTGYQTRVFGDAASRLGVDLVFATDRCHVLEDPWRDSAIPIRFHDEPASVAAIIEAARVDPIDGVLVVGDRPTVIAAEVARVLGLPGHPPGAAAAARNKQLSRERFRDAGLPVPAFQTAPINAELPTPVSFPCVVKPLALSGSRGVIRADDPESFRTAFVRLRAILESPEIRAERNAAHDAVLIEEFIPGRELALEGVLHQGALHVLALFDKPDPLDGPFFEETIYVTPSLLPQWEQRAIVDAVARAVAAIGLRHGPIHAECRVNDRGAFVLEVAARPIGGLCARALRFERTDGAWCSLEELLLRHAVGEPLDGWRRERCGSGVMMIPIPRRGVFRDVNGIAQARAVSGVDDVQITAKADQRLVPLPEGASYLGFIFARGPSAESVECALRAAHAQLRFTVDPELPVVQSRHA
jgi:biotin carboxylase